MTEGITMSGSNAEIEGRVVTDRDVIAGICMAIGGVS